MSRIRVAIEVHRAREVKAALDRASADIRRAVATETHRTADLVAQRARQLVPKHTGELASTIRTEPTNSLFTWMVYAGHGSLKRRGRGRRAAGGRRRVARATTIEPRGVYAAVVEFGSHSSRARQPAQPFMFPALEQSRAGHIARVSKAIDGACNAAGRNNTTTR